MSDLSGLTLYHFENCPFCLKVRHFLKQHQLAILQRDILKNPEDRAALIAGGGKKQVPCLHVATQGQDIWLYESDDIIAWINQHVR